MSSIPPSQPPKNKRRNPEKTRAALLEEAGKVMAIVGPDGLSVSRVAQLAGVNRGTAYNHFPVRDDLIQASKEWMSQKMCLEIFGDYSFKAGESVQRDPHDIIEKLIFFSVKNPEFGRVWLHEVLGSSSPASDPFWKVYKEHIDVFVESEFAEPGIDAEAHAVFLITSVFLWPVWAMTHAKNAKGRKKMAQRFIDEMLRLSFHGTLKMEMFPMHNRSAK